MKKRKGVFILVILLVLAEAGYGIEAEAIRFSESAHPAVKSAARIISNKLNLSEQSVQTCSDDCVPGKGQIVLAVPPAGKHQTEFLGSGADSIRKDGYVIVFRNGGALICGSRPRSLLYAAGDVHLWKDRAAGMFVREPSFAVRSVEYHGEMPMPDYVAATGLNLLIDRGARATVCMKETLPKVFENLSEEDQRRLERGAQSRLEGTNETREACHDADVEYTAFLYGNNFELWSRPLYEAALKAYPSIKGTPASNSWEKATLCPSDPMTWKLINAYLREYLAQTKADGLYTTFWDNYGLYCQCDRCKANGMNQFRNELYACVKQYHETAKSMGRTLIVRTWSSGVPHWLRDEWVHAPGYGSFGGSGIELWGRVFKELPKDIIIQTKVYNCDCQPDAPLSPLLGAAGPHPEIAEYQMTGQTTGRYYFPASTVNHTVWTMKKSRTLLGPDGGVNLFLGGTRQSNYFLLDDILNSINVAAWRELSWNVDADMDQVWNDWAAGVYGEKAVPHMVRALRLSEDAVNKMFSTLGMGSSTNSDFAGNIARRETLLMYTNRYYLPEYAKFLEPTKENIQRVIDEKDGCLKNIDTMFAELEQARPYLDNEVYEEVKTRFEWLKEFAIVKRYLEESLFRFRYLRYLNSMRTTDPEQMKYLAQAYDQVQEHRRKLFEYDPSQKFRCYDRPLGQLRNRPALGNPMPLMKELYEQSRKYAEEIVGPDYLPQEWKR